MIALIIVHMDQIYKAIFSNEEVWEMCSKYGSLEIHWSGTKDLKGPFNLSLIHQSEGENSFIQIDLVIHALVLTSVDLMWSPGPGPGPPVKHYNPFCRSSLPASLWAWCLIVTHSEKSSPNAMCAISQEELRNKHCLC